jgi:hypothetical protein
MKIIHFWKCAFCDFKTQTEGTNAGPIHRPSESHECGQGVNGQWVRIAWANEAEFNPTGVAPAAAEPTGDPEGAGA